MLLALGILLPSTNAKRLKLIPYSTIQSYAISESSGIAKSRSKHDLYWTHNDSGDIARIFAIKRDGSPASMGENANRDSSIQISNAANVDWEDIAVDSSGRIYIGDFGNNDNARRDLALYIIREPDTTQPQAISAVGKIPFAFPDQNAFPPPNRNFDCEALFVYDQTPYVLTKHRSDTRTTLYRFDSLNPNRENRLTKISDFDIEGKVTAADLNPDQTQLAVLTYTAIWIFDKPAKSDNFLENPVRKLDIKAGQCEAICWDDGTTLIVTNEEAELFEIKLPNIPRYLAH